MTQRQARQMVKELGGRLAYDSCADEYCVVFGSYARYYTGDLDDAVGTARLIAAKQGKAVSGGRS